MSERRIVAVALLTQRDVQVLGANFNRLWPVDETPCFSQLLQAIDEADRQVWRERIRSSGRPLPVLEARGEVGPW